MRVFNEMQPTAVPFDALSQDDIEESLGYRETAPTAEASSMVTESTHLDTPWQDVISQRAYDFIVRWETGGKAYYQTVIKGRPIWPGYASGITIGCGYDLGYHTLSQFEADWGTRIPKADRDRLAQTIGFYTVDPGRPAKVTKAKALVVSLSDIVVSWDVAIEQFDKSKMPALVKTLYGALDNLDKLHPHCRGALLSLVFNRGAPFKKAGDRYREMRKIGALMTAGKPDDFARIPEQLRSMKRIWGTSSSLAKRREEEAVLFEAGMTEESLMAGQTESALEGPSLEAMAAKPAEDHSSDAEQTDVDDDNLELRGADALLEAAASLSAANVKWNANDDDQPDYHHVPKLAGGSSFELTAVDLENLIRFNSFDVIKPGLLVFALRGARISGGDKKENVDSVTIEDIRPDHRAFKCVIGVLNRETKKLWAYKASTVPNAAAVFTCYTLAKAHVDPSKYSGNILPTGCYTYTVGTHKSGQPGEIRGVLRLSTTSTGASTVAVLRSLTDLTYDRRDFWHPTAPADNIHPGRSSTGFSSLGCLTLPGNYAKATKTHSGLWADFRVALGMGKTYASSDDGRQFSCMLVTGLDAAVAVRLREGGDIDNEAKANAALRRLRHGSKGDVVAKLQGALGLAPDASKLLGPITRKKLVDLQQEKLGWADGIYSPEMEAVLKLHVF